MQGDPLSLPARGALPGITRRRVASYMCVEEPLPAFAHNARPGGSPAPSSHCFDTHLPYGMPRFAIPVAVFLAFSLLATGLTACDSGGGNDTAAPAAPLELEATSEEGAVALDWSAPPDDDVDGYKIYRSTSSFSSTGNAEQMGGGLVNESSYRDNEAEEGTTYYYRVTAVDEAENEGDLSSEVSTGPADTTAPAAPSNLSGSTEDGAVSLGWSAPSASDMDGYNVYRAASDFSSASDAQQINSGGPVGEASYRDDTVENGTGYYYRVTAVDEAGNESGLSKNVEQTPLPDPPGNP